MLLINPSVEFSQLRIFANGRPGDLDQLVAQSAIPAAGDGPALDVVAGHFASQARLSAYSGAGTPLPGWPRPPANYMSSPPTTMDVDGDGVDEIFTDEQDWHLHAYHGDGTPATGWPTTGNV